MRGFIATVFGSYIAVNAYLFLRLFQSLSGTGTLRNIACAALLLFAASFPAGRILAGRLPDAITRAFMLMGNLYISPMLYGFLLTLSVDIFRAFNGVFAITHNPPPYSIGVRLRTVAVIFAVSLLITVIGAINANTPIVKEVFVSLGDENDEVEKFFQTGVFLKIAVLSDTHLGEFAGPGYLRKLAEKTNAASPDIVLLPGDIIDGSDFFSDGRAARETAEIFKSFRARLGVWGVPGNHDYYTGVSDTAEFLSAAGVRLLRDEAVTLDGKFVLAGRNDRTSLFRGGGRKSLEEILSSVPLTDDGSKYPIVLMDHQPFDLHEAEECGVTLQVSGHTHRGQLWPINFIVSRIYECSYGEYKRGRTNYYISSGAGVWGPPVRTAGRPEIIIVNLYCN